MKMDRRTFVTLASGLLGSPLFAVAGNHSEKAPLFISAASDGDDRHWVIGFSSRDGVSNQVFKHPLPARAHHIAVHEALGIYVVIARRPGSYLWVGDLATGEHLGQYTVPADRHLFGHGLFSADGKHFYTTENAWQLINGDSGRVAVWEVSGKGARFSMRRSLEFPSYGVGPHELLLSPDERTLIVANGGIRTHPDRGREKLNIESMQPSLVYIDSKNGHLLEQHMLDTDYHKASIRHMDINVSGQLAIGMQYEGEPFHRVPLLAMHRQGEALQSLWAPEPQQGQMAQYVGSVRFDESGRYFAASCPRGNLITFWDAQSGEMLDSVRSRDGCGVCATNDGFVFTAGTGRITGYNLTAGSQVELDGEIFNKLFWDNHLSRVTPS